MWVEYWILHPSLVYLCDKITAIPPPPHTLGGILPSWPSNRTVLARKWQKVEIGGRKEERREKKKEEEEKEKGEEGKKVHKGRPEHTAVMSSDCGAL